VKGLLERLIVRRFSSTGAGTLLAPLAPNGVEAKCPLQAVSWLLWLAAPLSGDMPASPRRGPHPHAD
jgi:hypothetical protein